ncbi:MAG TPA: SlyX family protein [Nevskiaceae bacterium]|nr:SlyX family protein [Nevskiaceae bacterium]
MTDDRLVELESRLAFTDHNVEELNAALTAQQRRIDTLERLCHELMERVRGMGGTARPRTAAEEVPPHY